MGPLEAGPLRLSEGVCFLGRGGEAAQAGRDRLGARPGPGQAERVEGAFGGRAHPGGAPVTQQRFQSTGAGRGPRQCFRKNQLAAVGEQVREQERVRGSGEVRGAVRPPGGLTRERRHPGKRDGGRSS